MNITKVRLKIHVEEIVKAARKDGRSAYYHLVGKVLSALYILAGIIFFVNNQNASGKSFIIFAVPLAALLSITFSNSSMYRDIDRIKCGRYAKRINTEGANRTALVAELMNVPNICIHFSNAYLVQVLIDSVIDITADPLSKICTFMDRDSFSTATVKLSSCNAPSEGTDEPVLVIKRKDVYVVCKKKTFEPIDIQLEE